jgi:hypothetical protein
MSKIAYRGFEYFLIFICHADDGVALLAKQSASFFLGPIMIMINAELLVIFIGVNSTDGAFVVLLGKKRVVICGSNNAPVVVSTFPAFAPASVYCSRNLSKFRKGFYFGAVDATLGFVHGLIKAAGLILPRF